MSEALRGLEQAKGGPFTFRLRGVRHTLPDPAGMRYEHILDVLARGGIGLTWERMPLWQLEELLRRWSAHHDLGTYEQARRLCYVLDRYRPHIESDLHVHARASLGDLWRARQWRLLLNLIDHLPRHSHYAEAVSNDEEHAEMLMRAQQAAEEREGAKSDVGPPLHTWSPEVAVMADVVDAVNQLNYTLQVVNSDPKKGKKPRPPKPYPRPKSALDAARAKVRHDVRQAKHKSLAARLLPHKYGK